MIAVKDRTGHEWGFIKRLIVRSSTKQIIYADVILSATGEMARIPWEHFDVRGEEVILTSPEATLTPAS